jgi:hypothetical protein
MIPLSSADREGRKRIRPEKLVINVGFSRRNRPISQLDEKISYNSR